MKIEGYVIWVPSLMEREQNVSVYVFIYSVYCANYYYAHLHCIAIFGLCVYSMPHNASIKHRRLVRPFSHMTHCHSQFSDSNRERRTIHNQ